jgi:hypothetical protein
MVDFLSGRVSRGDVLEISYFSIFPVFAESSYL